MDLSWNISLENFYKVIGEINDEFQQTKCIQVHVLRHGGSIDTKKKNLSDHQMSFRHVAGAE